MSGCGRGRSEEGFTLPELMVVVLIIGILIAIALPVFLGARTRAEDRAAQADLRSALVAAMAYYAQAQTYSTFNTSAAQGMEPQLRWDGGGAPATGEISIQAATSSDLLLVGLSKSATYFCVTQVAGSPSTDRGKSSSFGGVDTVAECTGGW